MATDTPLKQTIIRDVPFALPTAGTAGTPTSADGYRVNNPQTISVSQEQYNAFTAFNNDLDLYSLGQSLGITGVPTSGIYPAWKMGAVFTAAAGTDPDSSGNYEIPANVKNLTSAWTNVGALYYDFELGIGSYTAISSEDVDVDNRIINFKIPKANGNTIVVIASSQEVITQNTITYNVTGATGASTNPIQTAASSATCVFTAYPNRRFSGMPTVTNATAAWTVSGNVGTLNLTNITGDVTITLATVYRQYGDYRSGSKQVVNYYSNGKRAERIYHGGTIIFDRTYPIEATAENVTAATSNPVICQRGSGAILTFTPADGYAFSITHPPVVTGASYDWDEADGELHVYNPNAVINAEVKALLPVTVATSDTVSYIQVGQVLSSDTSSRTLQALIDYAGTDFGYLTTLLPENLQSLVLTATGLTADEANEKFEILDIGDISTQDGKFTASCSMPLYALYYGADGQYIVATPTKSDDNYSFALTTSGTTTIMFFDVGGGGNLKYFADIVADDTLTVIGSAVAVLADGTTTELENQPTIETYASGNAGEYVENLYDTNGVQFFKDGTIIAELESRAIYTPICTTLLKLDMNGNNGSDVDEIEITFVPREPLDISTDDVCGGVVMFSGVELTGQPFKYEGTNSTLNADILENGDVTIHFEPDIVAQMNDAVSVALMIIKANK